MGNDIVLENKAISRKHAEISRLDGSYFIADLESGNGTYLNGVKLKPHEKTLINPDDKIVIEDFEIRFRLDAEEENPFEDEHTESDIIEIKMIKKVLSAIKTDQDPYIEVIGPPCEGKRVYITEEMNQLVIGREAGCELVIDSNMVSRRHAALERKWGNIVLTDLASKNGTFIGKDKVTEKSLEDGDVFLLGDVPIRFKNPHNIDLEAISKEYQKDDSFLVKKSAISSDMDLSLSPLPKKSLEQASAEITPPSNQEKKSDIKEATPAEKSEPAQKREDEKKEMKNLSSQESDKLDELLPKEKPVSVNSQQRESGQGFFSLLSKLSATEIIFLLIGLIILFGGVFVLSILWK